MLSFSGTVPFNSARNQTFLFPWHAPWELRWTETKSRRNRTAPKPVIYITRWLLADGPSANQTFLLKEDLWSSDTILWRPYDSTRPKIQKQTQPLQKIHQPKLRFELDLLVHSLWPENAAVPAQFFGPRPLCEFLSWPVVSRKNCYLKRNSGNKNILVSYYFW